MYIWIEIWIIPLYSWPFREINNFHVCVITIFLIALLSFTSDPFSYHYLRQ